MYEATVSVVKENNHLLDYVKGQLAPCLKEIDGVSCELDERFRSCYSLACSDTYRFQVQRKLNDAVSQALTLGYKNVYVRDLLGLDSDNFYKNVLVNVICVFDNDYDRQIVSRLVEIDQNVCIDGYYNFRLGAVKKKWSDIIRLVSDNLYVLSDNSLIVEFLQYLLESTPSKVKVLSVSFEGDGFTLYGSGSKVLEPAISLAKSATVEEEAMLNILSLKPQRVKIYHSNPLSDDFVQMLSALFSTEYIEVE
ncbi:MAG: hypothetical protein J1F66_04725 [Clostridiales bacterium]|nr:hypothetical protein [Clostridiales bacterium]